MPSIVEKQVGAIGFGLMGLTWHPQPPPNEEAFSAMSAALRNGSNLWNGGEIYGTPERNSLHLLKEYFQANPADINKVVLSIKGGYRPGMMMPDGSEQNIRRSVDECVRVLDGTIKIDIFECARVDPHTPIETTMEVLKTLVEEGKIGGIGLSEVSAKTIRRAHKVHPIAAVEGELSLWAVDNLENDVLSTCANLGIPFIAYSPLGRGILTGSIKHFDDIPTHSFMRHLPKYQADVLDKNMKLVEEVRKMSLEKNCTMAQLALAWVKCLSKRPGMPLIIPIPGASTQEHVSENLRGVELTDTEAQTLDNILAVHAVRGQRYGGAGEHLSEL